MRLKDILKKVGTGIIKEAIPGGGMLMGAVNELLPTSKQLNPDARGDELEAVIDSLPAAEKAKVLAKEFDVDIEYIKESGASNRAMLEAEMNSKHTTRPLVIKLFALIVSGITVYIVYIWGGAIVGGKTALVLAIGNGWPMILALCAPFFVVINAYFGILRKERQNKLDAANGNPTGSMASTLISGFLNRK